MREQSQNQIQPLERLVLELSEIIHSYGGLQQICNAYNSLTWLLEDTNADTSDTFSLLNEKFQEKLDAIENLISSQTDSVSEVAKLLDA